MINDSIQLQIGLRLWGTTFDKHFLESHFEMFFVRGTSAGGHFSFGERSKISLKEKYQISKTPHRTSTKQPSVIQLNFHNI